MPSRFAFYSSIDNIKEKYNLTVENIEFYPYYNLKPTNRATGIINEKELRVIRLRWGFLQGKQVYKARGESIHEKKMFRDPFREQRCLIFANGFFEWEKEDQKSTPHFFTIKDEKIFLIAGIYNTYKSKEDNKKRYSFAVITVEANDKVASIFHRMPGIIPQESLEKWLDPNESEETLLNMLNPYDSDKMDVWKVKTLPSRGDNGPATIKPLSKSGLSKFL
ncbi:MAG: putative SOS response-associated peptidase YedK [Candidatus Heimdallarchaeota archaeon LC_3]|nr:MAG: putative SOS response-associated peptidase YedK [Candidatus Heimdallarchaeota archaeon LC_3]